VAVETKVTQFIPSSDNPGGRRLGAITRDLETAATMAAETGVRSESLAACLGVWRRALDVLGPDADEAEIHRVIGSPAGA
jgi:hypothetical protein